MMFASAACSDKVAGNSNQRLVVAATAVPHAEILEHIKPTLKAQGVDLEIRVFNDYVQPNSQVAQKLIDVNYFQTGPYLHAYNRDHRSDLVEIVGVHIEPFGAYSRRHRSLNALPANAEVAIPNDPSNGGRALLLLQQADVIRLNDPGNALSTLADIRGNPKQLRFRELDAAMLPRVLDQVDLALINTNYALD
ncbi:MAG: methionine ABC transporter substrate-binding protein, partial [Xanthomonadaceae bacterium]|nr:methionine ABC transporter substrate-binding protein [Xanthomonadaceae bacterium]